MDEPRSGYYEYPILVFDFASLYPSVIAAYNMCYCTILQNLQLQQDIGPFKIQFRPQMFKQYDQTSVKNDFIFTRMKTLFAKQNLRQGVLPKIMSECLKIRKEIVERENKCESGIERLHILYKQLQ